MAIVRSISKRLTLYKTLDFPASYKTPTQFRHRAIIGLGGNVGDVHRRFVHLLHYLKRTPSITLLETSPLLQNPPFGYTDQDDFVNAVIEVGTNMNPHTLLNFLLRTEKHFGRQRSFANAPRTLDLDLIFFDKVKMTSPVLTLPHPHWSERESVMIPLQLLGRR